jgi:hypothetical protein
VDLECEMTMVEVNIMNPFGPLRNGEIDVLYDWLVVDGHDLAVGPVLDCQDRLLAVACDDPLARKQHIGAEQLVRDDIVLIPIGDLPPLPLGLIWRRAHEHARIRALLHTAQAIETPSQALAGK